ncbi:unnamed protein product [Pichia kudriavzevii]
MPDPSTVKIMRLHVGGISKELANSISDLEQRFSKIGKIVKPFEVHEKPVVEYRFAYVTMKLNKKEYSKLKQTWDGVKFKGSKLKISIATIDYRAAWEKDSRRQDNKIKERRIREIGASKRADRISKKQENPFDAALITKGRFRKTPRKGNLKLMTVRVILNGRAKRIKCKISKLWGYDKNKKLTELTHRFIAGEWRDGNDHVVDRFTGKVVVLDEDGIKVYEDKGEEIVEEIMDEKMKQNKILEAMLNKYNFEKPVEIDNSEDECAGPEYEMDYFEGYRQLEKVVNFDTGEEEEQATSINSNNFLKGGKAETEAETEAEEDHDYEFLPTFGKPDPNVTNLHNDDESEEEFIPSFGTPQNTNKNTKNTTEKLRDLLDTSKIAQTPKPIDVVEKRKDEILLPTIKKTMNVGLFFPHFDSAFLVAQSQINKLREIRINEEFGYDEWFWKSRGELNREFRKLRRDALRRNKKKSKATALI